MEGQTAQSQVGLISIKSPMSSQSKGGCRVAQCEKLGGGRDPPENHHSATLVNRKLHWVIV